MRPIVPFFGQSRQAAAHVPDGRIAFRLSGQIIQFQRIGDQVEQLGATAGVFDQLAASVADAALTAGVGQVQAERWDVSIFA